MLGIEERVSFEVAKLLKKKGYQENCDAYYHLMAPKDSTDEERFEVSCGRDFNNKRNRYRIAAPLIHDVLRWYWNHRGIFVGVYFVPPTKEPRECKYSWYLKIKYIDALSPDTYDTYKEAIDAGLKWMLS